VQNVLTGERYTATAGGGAFETSPARPDPVRLRGSNPASLEQTLVATGFGYRVEQRRAQGAVVAELLPVVRDIRRHGSAALDLCTVATGRLDAYYESGLNPWDHAAGGLVAAEAGLVVTGLPGRAFADPLAIAVPPSVAGPFVDLLDRLHRGQAAGESHSAAALDAGSSTAATSSGLGSATNSGPITKSTRSSARVSGQSPAPGRYSST
jgi:myo-inositol-1(or 4)-monophosphatase